MRKEVQARLLEKGPPPEKHPPAHGSPIRTKDTTPNTRMGEMNQFGVATEGTDGFSAENRNDVKSPISPSPGLDEEPSMNNEVRERLTQKGILPDDEMGLTLEEEQRQIAKANHELMTSVVQERLLSSDDFAAFSAVLGLNIQTKEELLKRVKLMTTVNVEGVEITLDPRLLTRLKSRAVRIPFPEYLRDTVRKALFDVSGY